MAAALANAPDLHGAACVGRARLFDIDGSHARDYTEAIAICHQCPALIACGQWLDSLGPRSRHRPAGVVAGRLIIGTGTGRRGRPATPRPAA
jgi:hypothetical protein